ncbi:MAG: hypothetical protein QOG64_372 [Acidimicrobiaceae bacterium]|nr:hypothetical protein [Acidimicrobiaceae bacterium]
MSITQFCDIRYVVRSVEKGERTRRALLDSAIRRFSADGFQRTSVSEVARDVGVTPAAVYAYFPSKEALFAAAVDADAEELVTVAGNVLIDHLESETLPAVITRLADAVLAGVDRHPLALKVLSGSEPIAADRILELPSLVRLRHLLADGITYGQAAGQVRVDVDAETMALGFETIVLNQLSASVQEGYSAERWQAVIAVLEAAIRP